NIETTPFVVNTEARAWPAGDGPRRAGVSSFGLGGTNAHVVLEEAPTAPEVSPPVAASLILLSAKTATALETLTGDLASYLERHPDIDVADVAHTTQVGRTAFEHRRFAVCRDTAAALQLLTSTDARARATRAPASAPAVAFLLPGQGSQYPGMAARLYDLEPGFRREFDRCRDILAGLGVELADAVACPAGPQAGERLRQTENAQPALFAMEYALARLWQSWGIEPQALLGHSIGEYVAACLAGVFSLTDALTLVAARGRLMQQAPRGAMLSVALGEAELGTLPAGVEVAAVNAPDLCVVAGPEPHIDELAGRLAGSGVRARRLHTSHAFHSPAMAEVAKDLRDLVESVKREPPSTPFISNVTGEWVTSDQARDPDYWATHTTAPVRFADGIATLAGSGYTTLLEAGPGQSLTTFARRCGGQSVTAVPSMPAPGSQTPDDLVLESALGELWSVGAAVDWRHRNASRRRRRVPLPTYPFERQRYRLVQHATDAGPALTVDAAPVQRTGQADHPAPEVDVPLTDVQRAITAIWVDLLGVDPVRPDDDFFALGGHSLLGTALIATLRERFGVQVRLRDLFAARTVTRLADLVESLQWSAHASCEAPDGTPAHYEEGHL
ncbi:MAG TPA: type I polyketide synthase, partial [Streptosporangiaceae bacterium]|nr:type I polyketide synthase [Streptosporangiaceae bacterium]